MRPEDGKRAYDSIEIPEELGDVVKRAIASVDKEAVMKSGKRRETGGAVRIFRYAAATAAGLLIAMTVGVNTSEAFAKEMSEVPVLGALAKVLTVRSYHGTDGDYEINMEVPEIEVNQPETAPGGPESAAVGATETETGAEAESTASFVGDINVEIQKIVDDYMAQAKVDFEDYKKAFFETGGTEEEWGDRTMNITVDYDVKYQQGDLLSLELTTSKAWVASQAERHYYNLNLATGEYLTLEGLLGEGYIEKVNESVKRQIEERIAADEMNSYFGYGPNDDGMIEGFTTITEDTPFYLNENGNVVVVFEKYEIAPGYMGFQEFVIE